ncbi:MAG: hypothetical protein FJY46_06915, partial [Betaproteobacteria bacterium]|nr:hypothetical protein [Betaproteobacteria bacterium]
MDHANQAAVGIIGLGIMGSALADQLINKGFSVFGFDPDPKARKRASRSGVQVVSSVELLLSHSQQLLSSLPSSDAFEATCEALIEHLTHSTPKPANQAPIVLAETSTLPISIKQRQQRRLATAG